MKDMYLKEEKGKFYIFDENDTKISQGFKNTTDAIEHKTKILKEKTEL